MEQEQNLTEPKEKKTRRGSRGRPLGQEWERQFLEVVRAFGVTVLVEWIVANVYAGRSAINPTAAAATLLARHVSDPQRTVKNPFHDGLTRMVEHFTAQMEETGPDGVDVARPDDGRTGEKASIVVAEDSKVEALSAEVRALANMVQNLVGMAAQNESTKALPEPAPVVEMADGLEDRINKFVQDEVMRRGGRNALRGPNRDQLFSDVWNELDEQMWRECGFDPGARARRMKNRSRIDVCREVGFVSDLYKLAHRMFGPHRRATAATR